MTTKGLQFQSNTQIVKKPIGATVVLGRQRMNCAHLGICRIEPRSVEIRNHGFAKNKVQALLTCIDNANLSIRFSKTNMTRRTEKRYFGTGNFTLMEDFLLPKFITDYFELQRIVIPKGKYQISNRAKELDITFELI